MDAQVTVLIVEDEQLVARHIAQLVREFGHRAERACDAQTAFEVARRVPIDLVLADINLGGGRDGVEIASRVREAHDAAVIFLTAYSDPPTLQRALSIDPSGYLVKPFAKAGLRCALEVALQRRAVEREFRRLALTDELTGLYNRRGFTTQAERRLTAGRTAALFYFDLDGLKAINDSLGHEAGDLAIRSAAEVLRTCFRHGDVVARLGGDEFAVLMVDGTESLDAIQVRIAARSSELARGLPFELSISGGAAEVVGDAPYDIERLLATADAAMYRNKVERRRARPAA